MPRSNNRSRGQDLAQRLSGAVRQARNVLRRGARTLPVVADVKQCGASSRPIENVYVEVTEILTNSGRVYRYGNNVVMETGSGCEAGLLNLSTDHRPQPAASSLMANLFVCSSPATREGFPGDQFPPPPRLVETILTRQPTLESLPRIELYARRPIFDEHFVLQRSGWNPETGILIHGFDIESYMPELAAPDAPLEERLPPHLNRLLGDFCFRDGADRVNAVAVLLTGLLIQHFIRGGKPVVLIDGNQPGLGKTWLARSISIVLDGVDPKLVPYTRDDEELSKRICATLRDESQSALILDNAKVRAGDNINSPTIEANSMVPEISIRILGQSVNYTRPNDVLWYITMNSTKASPDLVSRGLPIRLQWEGPVEGRDYKGRDPLAYARDHRREILAELAGMVDRWDQAGRLSGHHHHRLTCWADTISGILCVNHLHEGLTNLGEAASEFDTGLDAVTALAEAVVASRGPYQVTGGTKTKIATTDNGSLRAAEWEDLFRKVGIQCDQLQDAKSDRAKSTIIGNFLTIAVGREVPVEIGGRRGKATLRVKQGRSNTKLYHFDVCWDDTEPQRERQAGVVESQATGRPTKAVRNREQGDAAPTKRPNKAAETRRQAAPSDPVSAGKDGDGSPNHPTAARLQSPSAGGQGNNEQW